MQKNVSNKKYLQFYRQCPVIAEASDFPRTFPNMSKRSFSLTLIDAYFSLSEIRKIPSLSFCNFLISVSYTHLDYDYAEMPQVSDGQLTVIIKAEYSSYEGLRFTSNDNGKTWMYEGLSTSEGDVQ